MNTLLNFGIIGISILFLIFVVIVAMMFRRVVPTDQVHIVQSRTTTTSYGRGQKAGNTYYGWPSWIPVIGVVTKTLPVSVFSVNLTDYPSYDKNRLPFILDITAFFRVVDANMASERVSNQGELLHQLHSILQGSVRSILAKHDIETILEGRSQFGDAFTQEVDVQLQEWGVHTVKTIELMDIRDDSGSKVISNIMAKESSRIDRESRVSVADNKKQAETAEIEATREVALKRQEAEQQIGIRTAEKERDVGIAREKSNQEVKVQARITQEKDMDVVMVKSMRTAEIQRGVEVVLADQERQKAVIAAEADRDQMIIKANGAKEQVVLNATASAQERTIEAAASKEATELIASGDLAKALKHAEGVLAEGKSVAESERLRQLATVAAQVALADRISESEAYQRYLVSMEQVAANRAIGVEQAKALESADIKMIVSTGDGGASTGLHSVGEVFTPKGGTSLGVALEAFSQTNIGKEIVSKLLKERAAQGTADDSTSKDTIDFN